MGSVITNLKARFGVDTGDFRKGLKDGESAINDFKGVAGGQLESFASMFGVNMGAVSDAIGTAGKSLNFLSQAFKASAAGGNVLTIAVRVLKVALISSGIGAIVVALGTLAAYFTKSGAGADQFARILAQVKSVINNVIDRLAVFGKGLWEMMTGKFKQGWETMRGAFKGMGDEIKEDWAASGKLADRLDALEDKERELITTLEERRAKAADLRLQAKEELNDQKKKLDLIKEAEGLIKSTYVDEIGVERERLSIMKERLAIQATDPTDEQLTEIAEQEAKISSLLRKQAEELKALTREKNAALKIVEQEAALEQAKMDAAKDAIENIDISKIEIPDLAPKITKALQAPAAAVKTMFVDLATSINSSFESMAMGLGEFLGALAIGDAGANDFVKVIGGAFAELAITVGKICISAGLAKLALEKALMGFGGAGAAIAAGIALVAAGTAIKGSMARAAGASGVSGSATPAGLTYDTRNAKTQPVEVKITGNFELKNNVLVAAVEQEYDRKKVVT